MLNSEDKILKDVDMCISLMNNSVTLLFGLLVL